MSQRLGNTQTSYGLVAQILHWITAVLILTLGGLGLIMTGLPDGTEAEVADKFLVYSLHKTLGVTLLAVAVVRVLWTIFQPHPRPLHPDRTLETLAAQTVHWALYGAIILMPLTGWLHHAATEGLAPIWWPFSQNLPFVPDDPKLAEFFGLAHTSTAWLLGGVLALHIAGALKHAVIDKDGTLRRMIPGRASEGPDDLPPPQHRVLPRALAAGAFVALAAVIAVLAASDRPGPQTTSNPPAAGAAAWSVDTAKSRIEIEVIVQGGEVSAPFDRWAADITFDPDDLASASASIRVEVASLSLGSVTKQALAPEYLDAEAHPVATFTATEFSNTGDGAFEARGTLSLSGETKPVTLPFTLTITDGRAVVKGETEVNRLDFKIGPEGTLVAHKVKIRIALEATRAK